MQNVLWMFLATFTLSAHAGAESIRCNLDPDMALAGLHASISIVGNTVTVTKTAGGDDLTGAGSRRCNSGPISVIAARGPGFATVYSNPGAGLNLSLVAESTGGAVDGAVANAEFRDAASGEACSIAGHFLCH
jgi:hypothetical protein